MYLLAPPSSVGAKLVEFALDANNWFVAEIMSDDEESDLPDWILLQEPGRPLICSTSVDIETAVHSLGISRLETTYSDGSHNVVDLDRAYASILSGAFADSCQQVLEAWNLLEDILRNTKYRLHFDGQVADRAYTKLYASMNIDPFHRDGPPYEPAWTKPELRKMQQIFRAGTERIRLMIRDQAS
ncbi:hypothetical protein BJ980_001588 [Nocardioides daedukensis]|uniref:Uncharacterized protein n=1 Tax=Nocardioides daedukensis TaxID=634462 RepID=A0A7Y9UVS1_9ACTN|nr:hypothetical protein [Nocardioides daedukensis]NYG58665.1 hypothetical protein [Nocardioides daedukensis]